MIQNKRQHQSYQAIDQLWAAGQKPQTNNVAIAIDDHRHGQSNPPPGQAIRLLWRPRALSLSTNWTNLVNNTVAERKSDSSRLVHSLIGAYVQRCSIVAPYDLIAVTLR